ncbi:unnamed protein product, partial [Amoebophrya sp. A25]
CPVLVQGKVGLYQQCQRRPKDGSGDAGAQVQPLDNLASTTKSKSKGGFHHGVSSSPPSRRTTRGRRTRGSG